jgi:rhodanese-related sulfurtransferase
MNKKVTLITMGIFIIFISFVIFFTTKSVAKNESMDGMPGMSESEMEDMEKHEVHNINQSDLIKEIKNPEVIIVDIREPSLYEKSHIPNSVNIPFEEFQKRFKELDPKKNIILVCHVGSMGEASGQLLLEQGFQHVSNLSVGMAQWTGPIEQ